MNYLTELPSLKRVLLLLFQKKKNPKSIIQNFNINSSTILISYILFTQSVRLKVVVKRKFK